MPQPASSGTSRLSRPRLIAAVVALALTFGSLLAAFQIDTRLNLRPGPNEFNIVAWELRHLPGKWLFMFGELFRESLGEEEQDAYLRRFFDLNRQINALENEVSDASQRGLAPDPERIARLDALLEERAAMEKQVENTLESRISAVLREEGITRNFLIEVLWPPVDAKFTNAPRVLATSPRDEIRLASTRLLREDLTLADAERIEEETEAQHDVAALTFPTGGVGSYPVMINYPTDYYRAVEIIAHEWMHNYLFFRPLGFNYFASEDLRTMNETVADLVGHEVAAIVVERWPIDPEPDLPAAPPPPSTQSRAPAIDLRAELVGLRTEVDELLEQGRVEEAEARMEQKRQELAAEGFYIRRINQAYFAYLNLYAGEAGSVAATNPIGPKIDELRRHSDSLSHFVAIVGSLTSVAQLDRALEEITTR